MQKDDQKLEMNAACAGCLGADVERIAAEAGIDRRQFLLRGALAAAAVALAACAGVADTTGTNVSSSGTIKVSDYPELANVGGVALVTIQGAPLAVVRTSTTNFLALSRICPHQGQTIQEVSNGFYCPGHGATFSINGTWEGGQPTSNMRSYATTYDAATGTLTIG